MCNKCDASLAYTGGTSTQWRHVHNIHGIEKPKMLIQWVYWVQLRINSASYNFLNYWFIFHRHPTSTCPQNPSLKFGNTSNSKKMMKATRGGLCAMSVQTRHLYFAVEHLQCGTIWSMFIPLRIKRAFNNLKTTISFSTDIPPIRAIKIQVWNMEILQSQGRWWKPQKMDCVQQVS